MSGLSVKFLPLFTLKNLALTASALVLAVVLCFSFSPSVAFAAVNCTTAYDTGTPGFFPGTQSPYDTCVRTNADQGLDATGQPLGNGDSTGGEDEGPRDGNFITDSVMKILAMMTWTAFSMIATLMGLAGMLLNMAVNMFILDFGNSFAGSSGMLAAWEVLRNFAYIFIIGGIVYLGLSVIPGLVNYEGKKSIAKLMIFAVLLNFSYFITGTVIDITNAVSTAIYKQALPDDSACASAGNQSILGTLGDSACANSVGISGAAFAASGLSGVLNAGDGSREAIANALDDPGQEFILYALMLIFVTVCTFVFAAMAFLLLSRTIVLIFLLVTSPLGFVALAIPHMEELGKRWWKALIDNILYAPAALILILIALKIAGGINIGSNGQLLLAAAMQGETIGINGIMMFLIVMGLLYASVSIAQSFSIFGSGAVMDSGKNALKGLSLARNLLPNRNKPVDEKRGSPRQSLQDGKDNGVSRARNALRSFPKAPVSTTPLPKRGDRPIDAFKPAPLTPARTQVNVRPITPEKGARSTSANTAVATEKPTPTQTRQNIDRAVVVRQQMRTTKSSAELGKLQKELQQLSSMVALANVGDGGSEANDDYILAEKDLRANDERLAENKEAMEKLTQEIKDLERSNGPSRTEELEQKRQALHEEERLGKTYGEQRLTLLTRIEGLHTKPEKPAQSAAAIPSGAPAGSGILRNDVGPVSSSQLNALF